MTYAFTFDGKFCSGCKACQAACKDKNNLPVGVLWRRVYEVAGGTWQRNGEAWDNTVFAYNLSMSCNHCVHPKCAGVCSVKAYDVREDGIVVQVEKLLVDANWGASTDVVYQFCRDDSANRRIILPEAFLAIDEMLQTASEVFAELRVDEKAMQRNLKIYGPFAATERVLMAAVKSGADRQQMHELIRGHALRASEEIQAEKANPLEDLLSKDGDLKKFLRKEQLLELMKFDTHLGDAPERARQLAIHIQQEIKKRGRE